MARENNAEFAKKNVVSPKKLFSYISSAILVAILCIVVISFITVFIQIGQGKTPTLLGYRFYFVLTDSMTPNIAVNDVIISKEVTEKNLDTIKEGDVVTYIAETGEMQGNQVTHRIVKGIYFDETLNDYAVLTRGDKAGAKIDDPVRVSAIQAVMVKKSSVLSWFLGAMKNGSGFLIFFIIPLAVMLIGLLIKLFVTIKSPTKEKVPTKDERIEEIKRQAIEEYIEKNNSDK